METVNNLHLDYIHLLVLLNFKVKYLLVSNNILHVLRNIRLGLIFR